MFDADIEVIKQLDETIATLETDVLSGTCGRWLRRPADDGLLRHASTAIGSRPELVEVRLTVLSFA